MVQTTYRRIAITEIKKDQSYIVELIERVTPDNKRNTIESFVSEKYSEAHEKVRYYIRKYNLNDNVKIAVSSPFHGYEETTVKEWRE